MPPIKSIVIMIPTKENAGTLRYARVQSITLVERIPTTVLKKKPPLLWPPKIVTDKGYEISANISKTINQRNMLRVSFIPISGMPNAKIGINEINGSNSLRGS